MNTAILSLGSNIGNKKENLIQAKDLLIENNCTIAFKSSVYETEAWGNKDQDSFYNQVIVIQILLSAAELMELILRIESKMGRTRNEKWEPRIIDIDILFYNKEIIHSENITVPHPHLHERKFVLVPLAEIIPYYQHPILHKSVEELLTDLKDESEVIKVEK